MARIQRFAKRKNAVFMRRTAFRKHFYRKNMGRSCVQTI